MNGSKLLRHLIASSFKFSLSILTLTSSYAFAITDQEIAEHWSPVIYHDTNSAYGYEAEYITNFDYDYDGDGTNNWENLLLNCI
jgi:hypothetical protein